MTLAFWSAADRRSVAEAPQWMYSGTLEAPIRAADMPAAVQDKLRARDLKVPAEAQYWGPGPRYWRLCAPLRDARWIIVWAGAAVTLAGIMLVCRSSGEDLLGIAPYAGWAAVLCSALAGSSLGGWLWTRCDPLRLSAGELMAIAGARRRLTWSPLAGSGKVSTGGGYVLTGAQLVAAIECAPAWSLSSIHAHRGRFDGPEELYQIACAAKRLDDLEQRVESGSSVDVNERDQLTTALFRRLVVLKQCVLTLRNLTDHRPHVRRTADPAAFVAVVENELAAVTLENVTRDLAAHAGTRLMADIQNTR